MKEITTQELNKLMKSNKKFTLLDCRGVDYFNWEHLPNAVNLRWKYVKDRASQILPSKDRLIITSCDGFTCNSSIRCYKSLSDLGYTNLIEYSGGVADWKAHGYKTISESEFKITKNVYRFPDQNFYSEKVNSYLIEEDGFILLIDGPQNLTEEHEDFIEHFGKPIKILLSHNPTGGETARLQEKYKARIYLHKEDMNGPWLTVKTDKLTHDGFQFNDHLKVIHSPGHSRGSVCLFDSKNKVLFTGDHIQGTKAGKIRDFIKEDDGVSGDPKMRLKSAKKLLFYDFEMILPFHYEMIRKDTRKRLEEFVKQYEK
jgi:glyoxylase-like metal-dependent hydrolase (beta-lactamase superfamily II)/rhodanese-related sulfurtransferase